jgi:hypothetical protein
MVKYTRANRKPLNTAKAISHTNPTKYHPYAQQLWMKDAGASRLRKGVPRNLLYRKKYSFHLISLSAIGLIEVVAADVKLSPYSTFLLYQLYLLAKHQVCKHADILEIILDIRPDYPRRKDDISLCGDIFVDGRHSDFESPGGNLVIVLKG